MENLLTFFPDKKDRVIEYVNEQDRRFHKIRKHFLSFLKDQDMLNQLAFNKLYTNSSLTGNIPRELLLKDLISYFLNQGMPLQECKAFDFYTIDPVKEAMNKHIKTLSNIVERLFGLKAGEFPDELLLEEKCLLFKTTALITPTKKYSWGEILREWFKNNGNCIPQNLLLDQVGMEYSNQALLVPKQDKRLNFKRFVIATTLYYLFERSTSPLPCVESVLDVLEQSWMYAETDVERQNVIYFADTLSVWHQNAKDKFSFDAGYKLLSRLQGTPGEQAIYHVLHATLHYFNALRTLDVEEDRAGVCKRFLFEAIFSIPSEKLKSFDHEIKEKYFRPKFVLDQDFIAFTSKHQLPMPSWGEMILRFSRTKSTGTERTLDLHAHLTLVEKIEKILGGALPKNTLEDFLFFQMAALKTFEVLDNFEDFGKTVRERFLEDLSIPDAHYQEWTELAPLLIDSFLSPTLEFDQDFTYKTRKASFPLVLFGLARILQVSVYPKPFVSFEKFIPTVIWENHDTGEMVSIELKDAGKVAIDSLQMFEEKFPLGPLWRASWDLKKSSLIISIISSLNTLRTATFSLKLPQSAFLDLKLFRKLVDGLGKESLTEEEQVEISPENHKFSSSLPQSITSLHLKFDWFMNNSPLVRESFVVSPAKKQLSQSEIRAELFEFVRLLHSLFRKAFYSVLLTNRKSNLFESEIVHLVPCEDGFSLCAPDKIKRVAEIDRLRISDYKVKLRLIYDKWTTDSRAVFFEKDALKIKIGTEAIEEALVGLKIEKESTHNVTWLLQIREQEEELLIKYPPFKNPEDFILAMVWQLALLKQNFLCGH